jgi:GDP-4-dehydro-6-deoxy-D-mannose reductase
MFDLPASTSWAMLPRQISETRMKAWISGAGGMMGSLLVEMLGREGHEVLGTYHRPTIDLAEIKGYPLEEVNVADWCSVYDSIERFRPDVVYHLAAQSYPTASWARPIETLTTNVIGTAVVCEAARRLVPKARLLVAGSSAEYGLVAPQNVPVQEAHPLEPLHPYGVSKVATDLLAGQYHSSYGLHTLRVRIFNCTGPRKVGDAPSDFARRVVWLEGHKEENTIRVGNLAGRRTLVDVRDLLRGLMLLVEKGQAGQVYNLGGSTVYTMQEILDTVLRLSTRPDIVPRVDQALLRPNDEKIIWGDCSRLQAATGWRQEISLEQTISDMLEFWRSRPAETGSV